MLVTVAVITYNSSKYVIETLESIKEQDYENIELIVSDDCSLDNTCEICKQWLEINKNRFINVKLVSTDRNSGISANLNNALKNANGKWIKTIAGDDMLTSDCISSFVSSIKNIGEKILVCGTLPFTDKCQLEPRILPDEFFKGTAKDQEKILVRLGTIIEGPTLFLEVETLKKLGGFEERFPLAEDYSLYMKYLANGYRISLVKKYLIRYREHLESVSRGNNKFSKSIFAAIDYYASRAAWRNKMYLWWYHHKINALSRKINMSLLFNRCIIYFLRLFDFLSWKKKLNRG